MAQTIINRSAEYIDRKEAAQILNISTRTLDRYLRKNLLGSIKKNHRIYVKKNDIDEYINKYKVDNVDIAEKVNYNFRENQELEDENTFVDNTPLLTKIDSNKQVSIYKTLYYEFKKDLDQKSEKLEMANYKIGELETKMKNMVPALEYNKLLYGNKMQNEQMKSRVQNLETESAQLNTKLRQEKFNKIVYIALLTTLLMAVPVITILRLLQLF